MMVLQITSLAAAGHAGPWRGGPERAPAGGPSPLPPPSRQRRAGQVRPLGVLLLILGLCLLLLSGCGSAPRQSGADPGAAPAASGSPAHPSDPGRDGPGDSPPPNLLAVPDAEPRLEPQRSGGPNKPYEVLGQSYVPLRGDPPLQERGLASWYGRKFHGRPTASGERYDMYAMSAAHRTMPLPSYARVRNPANGRSVVVRVNDRGPFHAGRVIDLSYTAALKLGLLRGVSPVEVERITEEAIRSGSWRQGAPLLAETEPAPALASGPALQPAPRPAPMQAAAAPEASADGAAAAPDALMLAAGGSAAAAAAPEAAAEPVQAQASAVQPEAAAARGYWLQLGAFRVASGALDFRQRVAEQLAWLAPLLAVFSDDQLNRLQAGPYASRGDALAAAERLRQALQLLPSVVERR